MNLRTSKKIEQKCSCELLTSKNTGLTNLFSQVMKNNITLINDLFICFSEETRKIFASFVVVNYSNHYLHSNNKTKKSFLRH